MQYCNFNSFRASEIEIRTFRLQRQHACKLLSYCKPAPNGPNRQIHVLRETMQIESRDSRSLKSTISQYNHTSDPFDQSTLLYVCSNTRAKLEGTWVGRLAPCYVRGIECHDQALHGFSTSSGGSMPWSAIEPRSQIPVLIESLLILLYLARSYRYLAKAAGGAVACSHHGCRRLAAMIIYYM